jgi:murein DD-endopeptidase MepM/ murein hydrolase activator NlpD
VVSVSDWQPDARAFLGPVALLVFMLVGGIRELGGSRLVLGNRVVIRIGPKAYATVAHLRRGSVRVARGDRVRAGQVIAQVGNTGNSTEPHVHVQLQDHPWPWFAAGLPMTFLRPDGSTGMPAAHEVVVTTEPAVRPLTPA